MSTKIGIISDLHLYKKTVNIERALLALHNVDLLLLVGDIADRGKEKQYDILLKLIKDQFKDRPVYCVSGNHDNPARDDTAYRMFERKVNYEYLSILDDCGAFYKYINDDFDLMGLNPVYWQKQFFFPDKGRQLDFLREHLRESSCSYHIVMCHPPLIAHNPQRKKDMPPYMAAEQDKRLQGILDEIGNVILISGHTHIAPTVEFEATCNNLYINAGSICPTTKKEGSGEIQQGNVSLLEISSKGISVIVKGIHTREVFIEFSKGAVPRPGSYDEKAAWIYFKDFCKDWDKKQLRNTACYEFRIPPCYRAMLMLTFRPGYEKPWSLDAGVEVPETDRMFSCGLSRFYTLDDVHGFLESAEEKPMIQGIFQLLIKRVDQED